MKKNFKSLFAICLLISFSLLFTGCNINNIFGETKEYTVTFDLMYSGASNTNISVEDGSYAQILQATREGYTLLGWYSDVTYNFLFNFATPITQNLNLYAKWQINTYTLTLNKGYENLIQTINYTYGDNITLPVLERTTFNFDGWYLESTFNTLATNANIINQNINLYAKWSLITYNIVAESQDETYGIVNLDYNLETNYATIIATANEGYEFDGWYLNSILWIDSEEYSFTPSSDIHLIAKFREIPTSTLNITASSGVQISKDGITWTSTLSEADFNISFNMKSVSTDGTVVDGIYKFYKATAGDGYFLLESDNENYRAFDLYFLNQGAQNLTLNLSELSSVLDNCLNNKNSSLSIRVGFIVQGSSNNPSTAVNLMNGISSYIWEPNSISRTMSAIAAGAINNCKYNYNAASSDNNGIQIPNIDAYGKLSYNANYTTLVDSTHDFSIGDDGIVTILPCGSQITKIKVFIWFEGQDVDCNNATSSGDVNIDLRFDVGDAGTQLCSRTATNISTSISNTVVTLSGVGNLGATYTAYILENGTDEFVSLGYKLCLSTGSAVYNNLDINEIILNNVIDYTGTYEVIVTAKMIGSISSITSSLLEYYAID